MVQLLMRQMLMLQQRGLEGRRVAAVAHGGRHATALLLGRRRLPGARRAAATEHTVLCNDWVSLLLLGWTVRVLTVI